MSETLIPGKAIEIAKGVRRLLAPNAGMMTGPGTNTYLVGIESIAVIDPGPLIPEHIASIQSQAGAQINWILCTHTHPDHSPAARSLAAVTGAGLLGPLPPKQPQQDQTFEPHRVLADGDRLETDEFSLRAIHTPGHASNHLCYVHEELNWLFTGDHVMAGSTVVIDPPDGNMNQYLASLRKARDLDVDKLAPGHGHVLDNPGKVIDWIIDHRLEREAKIVTAMESCPGFTAHDLVPAVYEDVHPKLYGVAERSLLAHLEKLEEDGRATRNGDRWTMITSP
jgi:glyoxylase-like metal-dependent hydrolase (beta-lactamase superfamily II)